MGPRDMDWKARAISRFDAAGGKKLEGLRATGARSCWCCWACCWCCWC